MMTTQTLLLDDWRFTLGDPPGAAAPARRKRGRDERGGGTG